MNQNRFKLLIILTFILSICEAATLGALLPFLTAVSMPQKILEYDFLAQTLQYLSISTPTEIATFATLLFIASTLVTAALRFLVLKLQFSFSHQSSNDVAAAIFDITVNKEYVVVSQLNSSEIVSALTQKSTQMINSALMPLLQLFSSTLIFIVLTAGLLIIDWQLTIGLSITLISTYLVFIFFTKSRIKFNSRTQSSEYDRVIRIIQETFGGIREIILGNHRQVAHEKFLSSLRLLRQSQASTLFLAASPKLFLEAVVYIAIAAVAYRAFFNVGSLAMSIPTLGALAYAAQRLMPIIQQIYANILSIKGCSNLLKDLCELLENDTQENSKLADTSALHLFNKSIRLNGVSFSYPNSDRLTFENVIMEINPGDRVGILGKTGSGKSTLLDIILGLLHPCSGNISCDGVERSLIKQADWFRIFSHVPQSIYLADMTIFENIAGFGDKTSIDKARIIEMAELAHIKDEIEGFSDGFDTIVGERGVRLSGGQLQRIGIARALYRNAQIIILDEATSAVDTKIEEKIEKSLKIMSKELAIIKVAHRLNTLSGCNKIFKLEDGHVNFCGNFEDYQRFEAKSFK